MGAVERVGDDDAEHGVAEELQPFVVRQPAVLVGVGAVGQGALQQLGVQLDAERLGEPGLVGRLGRGCARLGPVRPREPACRRTARSSSTRCAAASSRRTRGSGRRRASARVVFHCDRRDRVLLRDIFRFGTATALLLLIRRSGPAGEPVESERAQRGSSIFVRVAGRQVVQPLPAGGAQPGAVGPAQRRQGQAQHHRVTHHRFDVDQSPTIRWTSSSSVVSSVTLPG